MSHNSHKTPDAASEETWLKEQMIDEDQINTDFIKLRMRIEIEEQWFGRQLQDEPLPDATDAFRLALRKRVRQEIDAVQLNQKQQARRRLAGWPRWVAGALATAAAVALVVSKSPKVEDTSAADSTIWLTAFEAFHTDALGTEMSDIESELNTITNALATLDNPWPVDDWTSESADVDDYDTTNSNWHEKVPKRSGGVESGT